MNKKDEKLLRLKDNKKSNSIILKRKDNKKHIHAPIKKTNKNSKLEFKSENNNNTLNSNNEVYSKDKLTIKKNILDKRKIKNNTNDIKINVKIKNNINIAKSSFQKVNISTNNLINGKWSKEFKSLKSYDFLKNQKLTEQELNTLEYKLAIDIDKRTYFQYYCSLLRKKQLILFTFLPAEDFNLITIKICLFLISFSLTFTINGFFFTDETMNNVYENNGIFDILLQIQQILYSTIICIVINTTLKQLSLSERNILEIKKEKDFKKAMKKSKKTKNFIKIKFLIFFILGTIFLLFFWYFISCFCVVYNNTQIILINDTLITFGLSLLYPFVLNLFPGFLRIPALRAKKKDKKILYKISLIVAII